MIGSGAGFFDAAHAATRPPAQASVVGGSAAQAGVLSSVVFITAQTSAATAMACSGTLLAPTVVLTAAHCVVDEETRTIRAASGIVVTAGTPRPRQAAASRSAPRAIAVHPDYDPGAIRSDAAVIRLATPVAVAPVTLAAGADAGLAAPGAARDLRRLGHDHRRLDRGLRRGS